MSITDVDPRLQVCIALVLGWPYLRKVDDTCVRSIVLVSGVDRNYAESAKDVACDEFVHYLPYHFFPASKDLFQVPRRGAMKRVFLVARLVPVFLFVEVPSGIYRSDDLWFSSGWVLVAQFGLSWHLRTSLGLRGSSVFNVVHEFPRQSHDVASGRSIPSVRSEGTSLGSTEASTSGTSSEVPSLIDARALRDLEVMKTFHDFKSAVTEGALVAIHKCYSIPEEYMRHAPLSEQRPYSLGSSKLSISVDALEVGLRFPLHPIIEECLGWWRISPSQVAPNSWRYLVAFFIEYHGAGIIPSRNLFMACFRLCKSRGGYYLTTRAEFKISAMDLSTLRDMPKMSTGKSTPAARVTPPPEVEVVHVEATPTPELHSREKEPTASGREVVPRVYRRPKSMKDLYSTTVRKDDERYCILHMADLYLCDSDSELRARWSNLKSLMQVWDDSRAVSEF
ncbi:hypothetical protein BHE74_00032337 [Ensete ventricosum]|nr:hypothetical protein BHE74_00032337 [Ensete ventricosum]